MLVGILEVEKWWEGLGCRDREEISGIPYNTNESKSAYIEETDEWWHSLPIDEREQAYYRFYYEED